LGKNYAVGENNVAEFSREEINTITELAVISNEIKHLRGEIKDLAKDVHEIKLENAHTRRLVNFGTGALAVLIFLGSIIAWFVSNSIYAWNVFKH